MGRIISVDIGGTHIRAAQFEQHDPGQLLHERALTLADKPGAYDRLKAIVQSVWPQNEAVVAIGVVSPGPLDPHAGIILRTGNIPEWTDFPITARLAADFGVPAFLDNDANAAALAEWMFGAARGHNDVLYITVSTGIGAGVLSEGRLIRGFHGLATELGHVIIDPDGPVCNCGFRGHVESFCSGPAIVRFVQAELANGRASALTSAEDLTARSIADAARGGDALGIDAYRRAGEYLGIAVAGFLHAFDPSVVVFGGGISAAGELLFEPFNESLRKHVFHQHYLDGLKIELAALGDDAGLLGAMATAQIAVQA